MRTIVEDLYPGKNLCKVEQMSNWERRPLRKSQMHYAMLDAFVLIDIVEKLECKQQGKQPLKLKSMIKVLDNSSKIRSSALNQIKLEKLPPLNIRLKYDNYITYLQNCLLEMCKYELHSFEMQSTQILYENHPYCLLGK